MILITSRLGSTRNRISFENAPSYRLAFALHSWVLRMIWVEADSKMIWIEANSWIVFDCIECSFSPFLQPIHEFHNGISFNKITQHIDADYIKHISIETNIFGLYLMWICTNVCKFTKAHTVSKALKRNESRKFSEQLIWIGSFDWAKLNDIVACTNSIERYKFRHLNGNWSLSSIWKNSTKRNQNTRDNNSSKEIDFLKSLFDKIL